MQTVGFLLFIYFVIQYVVEDRLRSHCSAMAAVQMQSHFDFDVCVLGEVSGAPHLKTVYQ